MYELKVKTRFAAAHFLTDYEGQCARLHGHTWLVKVVVRGSELDDKGMLVDFKVLKQAINEAVSGLDHQNLNALEHFKEGGAQNPTAENLAHYLYYYLRDRLADFTPSVQITRVQVNESPEAAAVYMGE